MAPNLQIQPYDSSLERQRLEGIHGHRNVWTKEELEESFEILGFMGCFCVVRDRLSGKLGSVEFQDYPKLIDLQDVGKPSRHNLWGGHFANETLYLSPPPCCSSWPRTPWRSSARGHLPGLHRLVVISVVGAALATFTSRQPWRRLRGRFA
jgi:hypothetical protein